MSSENWCKVISFSFFLHLQDLEIQILHLQLPEDAEDSAVLANLLVALPAWLREDSLQIHCIFVPRTCDCSKHLVKRVARARAYSLARELT
jgi:hypothetical protein